MLVCGIVVLWYCGADINYLGFLLWYCGLVV